MGIFLPPLSGKATQLCGFNILHLSNNSTQLHRFGIFNSVWYGQCKIYPPFSHCRAHLSHHSLAGWSASTWSAAFHLSTSYLHPAISSAHTHDHCCQSFHITKHIHCASEFFWPGTTCTSNSSNSSDSSSGVVLGPWLYRAPSTPLLHVTNFFRWLQSI